MLTTHDEAFAAALDRIPTLKADAELTVLRETLLFSIRLAAYPQALAPIYRPATHDAVRYARECFRHIIALDSREQLRKLMQQAAQRPDRLRGIPQPDDTRVIMGRRHIGD